MIQAPNWCKLLFFMSLLNIGCLGNQRQQPRQHQRGRNLTNGDIVLQDGVAAGTGNVAVFYNGQLWIVCDDGWDLRASKVTCRSLGYPDALGHTSQSYFGRPSYGELSERREWREGRGREGRRE